jgi:amino acid adenylation domain-containing protein
VKPALVKVDRTKPLPVSFAQARFLDRPERGQPSGALAWRIEGGVDAGALERALETVVARHESLRTTFIAIDGNPHQRIEPVLRVVLLRVEVSSDAEARAFVEAESNASFDLATGPLMRATLVRVGDGTHLFVMSVHPIAADAWSNGVITRELRATYEAFAAGRPAPLEPLSFDYPDFAVWQRSWFQGNVRETELAFWKEHLEGAPPALELPTDRPRAATKQPRRETIELEIPKSVIDGVRALGRAEDATPFMVLLTAYEAVLSRWSGQDDIVVGTPTSGRTRPELVGMVGVLGNTLAMRTRFDRSAPFVDVLREVKRTALATYQHRDVPFETLVDALGSRTEASPAPVFQAAFAMEDVAPGGVALEGVDVSLTITVEGEAPRATLTYDVALFDRATMERFAEHFLTLLAAAIAQPERPVAALPLMRDAEERRVLVEWNDTEHDLCETRCVHEMFEAQAAATPDAVALELGDTQLTYAELDARANQLAHALIRRGVIRGDVIAVCMERSVEMVLALYATLKAGAAYAPLDPSHPPTRLALIARDLASPVILTTAATASLFSTEEPFVVRADALDEWPSRKPGVLIDDRQLAYVIHTSGSTGKPKGVMNVHRGLRNRLLWMQGAYGLRADDAVLQKTPYTFDVSVWEFFWPLIVGARLVVARPDGHKDPHYLAALIRERSVTTVHFVPSMLGAFLESYEPGSTPSLRRVICSGEALPRALQDRHLERVGCELHNLYGPTEASIDVTYWPCEATDPPGEVPIGRPIWNTQMYVVDSMTMPCPIGVAGELCIGGVGLAIGYWKRPDLTAEKFVPNPFAREAGARMYRTGDLARWRADGALEYLGRIDHQVKVRGFRIELGEIETALAARPEVAAAVVVARGEGLSDKRLVAYVVARSQTTVDVEALKTELRRTLPEYMVPSVFVVLDALPLTPSGKVDRKALPAPDAAVRRPFVPPRSPTEAFLAKTFGELLAVDSVGVEDEFFSLGGHSLLVPRVVDAVRATLEKDIDVRTVFLAPKLADLGAEIDRAPVLRTRESLVGASGSGPPRVSCLQERLWLLDRLEHGSAAYVMPLAYRLDGPFDPKLLQRSLAEVVRRHEPLRTVFVERDGTPEYALLPVDSVRLEVVDLRALDLGAQTDAVRDGLLENERAPFDLEHGPLLRARLFVLANEHAVLAIAMHHIASDGWSLAIFSRELSSIYASLASSGGSALPELVVRYADFAAWQRDRLDGGLMQQQLAFWRETMRDAPAKLELPTDRPRPKVQRHLGGSLSRRLPKAVLLDLHRLARGSKASLFTVLLAGYALLLGRISGQRDVVVAAPFSQRTTPELEALVGFFMNTVLLRVDLTTPTSFEELVERVGAVVRRAFANADVPFDRIVFDLNPPRDSSLSPLAQVALNLLNLPPADLSLPGVRCTSLSPSSVYSKFDMTLYATEDGDGLLLELVYDGTLFDRERMERLLGRLVSVYERAAGEPSVRLHALELGGRDDALPDPQQVLGSVENEHALSRFFETARRSPERLAVVDGAHRWSYRELSARIARIGRVLSDRGLRPGDVVAVLADRNRHTIAAVLSLLAAGMPFTIVDETYPREWKEKQIAIAKVKACIDAREGAASELAISAPIIRMPADVDETGAAPERTLDGGSLAYVVFTSGTTGTPKGILGSHGPLSHFVKWQTAKFAITADDRFAVLSGLAHDPFLRDILTPLSIGASVHVPSDALRTDPDQLAHWLAEERITVCHITPSLGDVIALAGAGSLPALRWAFFGGERLSGRTIDALRRRAPSARVVNFYGTSETPQAMSFHDVTDTPVDRTAPVGRGIDDVQILVVNDGGRLAAIDEEGEVWIRTPYLALGYIDGSAGGFATNPFRSDHEDRVYRTGDRGRYLADGAVEVLGRNDSQVKIRGYRVELGEVEAAVRAFRGVTQCAVLFRAETQTLAAYVVGDMDLDDLVAELSARLPRYMVPMVARIEALPLTPNGKLDRAKLPLPKAGARRRRADPNKPINKVEARILDVLREMVGSGEIGRHDDFVARAGDALDAVAVASRMKQVFNVEVDARTIVDHPTVAQLGARVIEALLRETRQ